VGEEDVPERQGEALSQRLQRALLVAGRRPDAELTLGRGQRGREDERALLRQPERRLVPTAPVVERGRNETPLWLPEQRALVFAAALTAPEGELRVWSTPCHEERALQALRQRLALPFWHVLLPH